MGPLILRPAGKRRGETSGAAQKTSPKTAQRAVLRLEKARHIPPLKLAVDISQAAPIEEIVSSP